MNCPPFHHAYSLLASELKESLKWKFELYVDLNFRLLLIIDNLKRQAYTQKFAIHQTVTFYKHLP